MARRPSTDTRPTPPYVGFGTLTNLVDRMTKEGAPPKVDSSYLSTYSGGDRSKVLGTLRYLGLVDSEGQSTDRLKELVQSDDEGRKAVLAEALREHYPSEVTGGEGSQQQLESTFKNMGLVAPATLRKAVAFYLRAAEFSGLPLNSEWRAPRSDSTTAAKPAAKPAARKRAPAQKAPVQELSVVEASPEEPVVTTDDEDAALDDVVVDPGVLEAEPAQNGTIETAASNGAQSNSGPMVLNGLINSLPSDGATWTRERRNSFVAVFEAALDYFLPVQEEQKVA